MGSASLRQCVDDLHRTGQLVRVDVEVDPHLEVAEIHRRVFRAVGPAVPFPRGRGARFSLVSNLFGSIERARYMFRDTLEAVRRLVELKVDPSLAARHPLRYLQTAGTLLHMLPTKKSRGPVLANETTIDQLPQLQSWPNDGGAFI